MSTTPNNTIPPQTPILYAGSSPHIKHANTTQSLMRDVLIALLPATAVAIYNYGLSAFILIFLAIASAVAAEYLWNHFMKKAQTIHDLSAAVTGLLIALNVTSLLPWWMIIIASIFAIIIVKSLFGGIGHNFLNPALAARAMLLASWPVQMSAYVIAGTDAVSSATPLNVFKHAAENADMLANMPSNLGMFLNAVGGCMGEASSIALLIGAAYLIYRKVINWYIPVVYIGTTAILGTLFAAEGFGQGDPLFQIFSGGLILGAFFMATDYTTSPMTKKGKLVFAIGCGFLTFVIRRFGGYPEGVSYSILIMNLFVPLIDRYMLPRTFGYFKKKIPVGTKVSGGNK